MSQEIDAKVYQVLKGVKFGTSTNFIVEKLGLAPATVTDSLQNLVSRGDASLVELANGSMGYVETSKLIEETGTTLAASFDSLGLNRSDKALIKGICFHLETLSSFTLDRLAHDLNLEVSRVQECIALLINLEVVERLVFSQTKDNYYMPTKVLPEFCRALRAQDKTDDIDSLPDGESQEAATALLMSSIRIIVLSQYPVTVQTMASSLELNASQVDLIVTQLEAKGLVTKSYYEEFDEFIFRPTEKAKVIISRLNDENDHKTDSQEQNIKDTELLPTGEESMSEDPSVNQRYIVSAITFIDESKSPVTTDRVAKELDLPLATVQNLLTQLTAKSLIEQYTLEDFNEDIYRSTPRAKVFLNRVGDSQSAPSEESVSIKKDADHATASSSASISSSEDDNASTLPLRTDTGPSQSTGVSRPKGSMPSDMSESAMVTRYLRDSGAPAEVVEAMQNYVARAEKNQKKLGVWESNITKMITNVKSGLKDI